MRRRRVPKRAGRRQAGRPGIASGRGGFTKEREAGVRTLLRAQGAARRCGRRSPVVGRARLGGEGVDGALHGPGGRLALPDRRPLRRVPGCACRCERARLAQVAADRRRSPSTVESPAGERPAGALRRPPRRHAERDRASLPPLDRTTRGCQLPGPGRGPVRGRSPTSPRGGRRDARPGTCRRGRPVSARRDRLRRQLPELRRTRFGVAASWSDRAQRGSSVHREPLLRERVGKGWGQRSVYINTGYGKTLLRSDHTGVRRSRT